MTFNRNIEDPLFRSRKRKFANQKRLRCSKCRSSEFELVSTPMCSLNQYFLICAKCQAIANDDVLFKKDKNPSALLMSVIEE